MRGGLGRRGLEPIRGSNSPPFFLDEAGRPTFRLLQVFVVCRRELGKLTSFVDHSLRDESRSAFFAFESRMPDADTSGQYIYIYIRQRTQTAALTLSPESLVISELFILDMGAHPK